MNCGVNLVPLAQLERRARQRRRQVWLTVCGVLALLGGAAWAVEHTAQAALDRRMRAVERLDRHRAEVQQRLAALATRRAALLARLESVTGVRRSQPWPGRLVALTRAAPAGVFLTSLTINPPGVAAGDRRAPAAKGGAASRPTETMAEGVQDVRLQGYAMDHAELIQFLTRLQDLPGWVKVELVRATAEPVGQGTAVGFELACRTKEERP